MREDDCKILKPLVMGLAHKYMGMYPDYGISVDDLIQEGWLGALRAIETYDPSHKSGARLTTYAYWFIRGNIHKFCELNSSNVLEPLFDADIPFYEESPALSKEEVDKILSMSSRPEILRYKYFGKGKPASKQLVAYHDKIMKQKAKKFLTLR